MLEEDDNGKLRLTARSLREARLMDSFIREVMRLKGDTISTMRYTTTDVPLGDVIIPKGACLCFVPFASYCWSVLQPTGTSAVSASIQQSQ